ncbi:carbohydrate sulfotransferase 11-like [Prorops nasuta]|uniref:carbohydrate sulfotransferase 11-like n=1 Tax=Prorops nasuta TaxID=863751 RepID=UPI0034CFAABE
MTGWRIWRTILYAIGFWSLILSAGIIASQMLVREILLETTEPKRMFSYSSEGPNALARSALLERQERLQYNCDEIAKYQEHPPISKADSFRNVIVDEQHKLLYCYVPKVACTNWKRILMIATGKWNGNNPLEIPADLAHSLSTFKRLSNYTLAEIEDMLTMYDKLIVVRHPLERLLSAYRNKFEAKNEKSSQYFQSRFGKKIIKKYRSNATQESLTSGDDVTFREFVDFVSDNRNINNQNEHWKPINELCHPCLINYNLISKYESLSEDATEVLERIGVQNINFPPKPPTNESTSKKLGRYYSTLSHVQLQKLTNLYKLDFKLFDYSLEDVLGFSVA